MVKDETDLRERFDTQVRLRLTATHCDEDEAAACLERLTKCVTSAAKESLPVKQHRPMRKRYVSDRTRQLYEQRRIHFEKLTDDERRAATRAIGVSCREDYRDYVDGVLNDIEIAERGGNSREVSRLTRLISGKRESRLVNPSKDLNGNLLVTQGRLLEEWSTFLGAKFASPDADKNRSLECLTAEYDELSDDELRMCLDALRIGKAPGCDDVPIVSHNPSTQLALAQLNAHTNRTDYSTPHYCTLYSTVATASADNARTS